MKKYLGLLLSVLLALTISGCNGHAQQSGPQSRGKADVAGLSQGLDLASEGRYKEALPFFEKSAKSGNAYAQNILGVSYYEGRGVAKDPKKAAKWLQKSADQGNAEGQFMLGSLYLMGSGVAKDQVKGVQWLQKAAAQDHKKAKELLAKLGPNTELAPAVALYKEGRFK
jgi:FOG: TPR repeat, SEL1 subfamily